MAAQKKILKASEVKLAGARVEKVDLDGRRFSNKLFKDVPVGEEAVELETGEFHLDHEPEQPAAGAGRAVELEKNYDEQGNLSGLVIRCKCGEVIELEFTRD